MQTLGYARCRNRPSLIYYKDYNSKFNTPSNTLALLLVLVLVVLVGLSLLFVALLMVVVEVVLLPSVSFVVTRPVFHVVLLVLVGQPPFLCRMQWRMLVAVAPLSVVLVELVPLPSVCYLHHLFSFLPSNEGIHR